MCHRVCAALIVALLATLLSAPTPAQPSEPAVALVLEVRGTTEPALKPYRELRAGDRITLERGARLVVLHYDRECRTITVEGGSVTFPRRGEPVVKDGVSSAREGKCPKRLEARSTSGAVVMRAGAPRLPVNPAFTVAGERAAFVAGVRVLDAERKVLEASVQGAHFYWPSGSPLLTANHHYTIEFLASNSAVLASLTVFTTDTAENDPTLIVID